ncbi:NUDIX domain-containing protein [Aureimonas sp. AU12]|uniref:NUDIX domain-containing protein n=1 Tax=Aureimonas sp. AU12 TaxID=1638161 RepID=UPI0007860CB8|nr:NUDIX domain-containing protein [Aureimonas sp. AU12]
MNRIAARLIGGPLRLAAFAQRSMTLGVRVAAFDEAGRLFLVRHTYLPGWYMPGGGVDPGETVEDAAHREAREEGNLLLEAPLALHGVFYNRRQGRDHIVVYRCDGARQTAPREPDREIAESGFFALDALPESVTPATRRRLDEMAGRVTVTPDW